MIIVEQDKGYFINYDNTTSISVAVDDEEKEYAIIATTIKEDEVILGIYKTEERAKEVLDKIGDAYTITQMLLCPTITTTAVLKGEDISKIMYFKMPAE